MLFIRAQRSRTPRLKVLAGCCSAVLLIAMLAAACGGGGSSTSSGSSSTSGGGGAESTTASSGNGSCSGEPIKVMTTYSISGEIAVWGDDIPNSAKAAEEAINANCSLGRPLEVTVCDDQSTANGSLRCGVKAKEEGYLAFVGFSTGPASTSGPQAANLPAVFIQDDGQAWNHTNALSYPDQAAPLSVIGDVKTVAALKGKSYTFVGVDIPAGHSGAQLGGEVAEELGIKYEEMFLPITTKDFTSAAAQLWAEKPFGFNLSLPGTQPFIKSLESVGANLEEMQYIGTMGLLTPTQRGELGAEFSGYEVGSTVPTSETSNPGIAEMKEEFEAAGLPFSSKVSDKGVQEWTAVKALALALAPLAENGKIESLDSNSLVEAVVSHGEYNLPTIVPFNFEHEAEFSDPPLAKAFNNTRTFTTKVGVFRIENGTEKQLGEWQDLNSEFSLEAEGGA